MIENATQCNIDPIKFWDYTPYELSILIDKYIKDKKDRNKDMLCLAWYTEKLHRAKKLPKLEKLLEEDKPKRVMTTKEMLEQVKKLNSIFGGEIKNGSS